MIRPCCGISLLHFRLCCGYPHWPRRLNRFFTISTAAGNGIAGFAGDGGQATSANLNVPNGVAVDAAGNVYIADTNNNRIRRVALNGTITTVAGTGAAGFSGDTGPATSAMLNQPNRVSVDAAGNLYIADSSNNRIRKVTLDGTIMTVAGDGLRGYSGDSGPATSAALDNPVDVKPDALGNLFIDDDGNNVVRRVDTRGIVTTVAGNGSSGFSGDGGPAINASLNNPVGVTVDAAGNLYISDQKNNRIRKVTNGIIATVVGTGVGGYGGDGGAATAAELNAPATTALDASGNLYIPGDNRIRMVLANGTIWTVAGTGIAGYSGDGGPAISATIHTPFGPAVAPSGAIYFADSSNERIRLLTPVPQAPAISSGGVVTASAFGGFTSVSPGCWIEIYGSNLAADMRSWSGSDFSGVNAPTSLDGTSVTVGGRAAFIDYISPGQVNALVPSNTPIGTQQLTITTAAGTSGAFSLTVNATEPGLLAPSSFTVNGTSYAVALFSDGTYVLPVGAVPGITSRPAKPGDTIILYGIGFGPVTPSMPAGQLVGQANTLASNFQMSIGGISAVAAYAGLAPSYTGLYQFNVTVPNVGAGNTVPLTFTLGGVVGTQTLYIAIGN
jgi:uncharacterized protein (TIGR03437 family)